MSLVGDAYDEESLAEMLTTTRKNVKLIEDHDSRTSQKYKVSNLLTCL